MTASPSGRGLPPISPRGAASRSANGVFTATSRSLIDRRVPSLAPPSETRILFIPAKAGIQDEMGPRNGVPATHSASQTRVNALLLSRGAPRGDERIALSPHGVEHLAAGGGRLCRHQHEGDDAGRRALVHPVVDGAALHQHVAGLEVDAGAVELHVDLARNHRRVVDRIGAVVAWANSGA